jgi:hypothetical protein
MPLRLAILATLLLVVGGRLRDQRGRKVTLRGANTRAGVVTLRCGRGRGERLVELEPAP